MELPFEIAENIGLRLDAEDVLNCSLLNKFWRNALNSDRIWRPLCIKDFKVGLSEKPILSLKCRVEPDFEIPKNKCENLSDICPWRVRYAQEIRVVNNWRNGNFVAEDIHPESDLYENRTRRCTSFNNNILVYVKNNQFKFWAVTYDKFFELEPIPYSSNSPVFRLLTNGFIFQDNNILTYYTISEDKSFKLKFREDINKEMILRKEQIDYEPSLCCNNERFVVFQLSTRIFWYIIWDLEKCKSYVYHFNLEEKFHVEFLREYLCEGNSPILYLAIHYDHPDKDDLCYVCDIENLDETVKIFEGIDEGPDTMLENLIIYRPEEMIIFNKDKEIIFSSNITENDRFSVIKSYTARPHSFYFFNTSSNNLKLYDSDLKLKVDMVTKHRTIREIKRMVEIGSNLVLLVCQFDESILMDSLVLLDLKKQTLLESRLPHVADRRSYCNKSIIDFQNQKIYYFV